MNVTVRIVRWLCAAVMAMAVMLPSSASACAVCMGAPEAKLSQGAAWGIMSLLVIVLMVLGGIAAFFIFLARKAAAFHAQAARDAQTLEPIKA